MDFTTDKLKSLVRKWQSLIETSVDVRTSDNYTLRLFAIAFTKRRANQIRKTSYAQSAQIRQVTFLFSCLVPFPMPTTDAFSLLQRLPSDP